jgi:hypothetical protein
MNRWAAGEVQKDGITVPLTVDDYGAWTATVAGTTLVADTRDKLVTKIGQVTKGLTAEVAVPFTILDRGNHDVMPSVRHGVATGIHAGNGNILATMDSRRGEVREQLRRGLPLRTSYSKHLTDDESAEYQRLATTARDASLALSAYIRDHTVDLRALIEQALRKAAG